jgi:hypothetical protein
MTTKVYFKDGAEARMLFEAIWPDALEDGHTTLPEPSFACAACRKTKLVEELSLTMTIVDGFSQPEKSICRACHASFIEPSIGAQIFR